MPPVIAIAGHSQSGKTTLMERLVPELRARGFRVAAVKHTHKDIQIDHAGKDSWRFTAAGSDAVVISGPREVALIRRRDCETSFEEMLHLLGCDYDLVLIEGYHHAPVPRIEVHRREVAAELRCRAEELLAVVTDEPLTVDCPQFSAADVAPLADLLVEESQRQTAAEVLLSVNGAPVEIGSFVKRIITNTLLGLISTLKSVSEIRSLRISLRPGSRR